MQGALPPRTLTEYINYTDEGDSPAFKVVNNPYFDQENRVLIIEVEEGVLSDSVPPAWLGSFKIPLNEFEKGNTYNEPINIDWRQVSSDGGNQRAVDVAQVECPGYRVTVSGAALQSTCATVCSRRPCIGAISPSQHRFAMFGFICATQSCV